MKKTFAFSGFAALVAIGACGCADIDTPDVSVDTTLPVSAPADSAPARKESTERAPRSSTSLNVGVRVVGAGSLASKFLPSGEEVGASAAPITETAQGATDASIAIEESATVDGVTDTVSVSGGTEVIEEILEAVGALFGL